MIGRLFSHATGLLFLCFIGGVALPGTHRIVVPESYGLTEIAPGIWTDAPGRRGDLLALLNEAKGRVDAFFGDTSRKPNAILCATDTCAKNFGIGGNGLSIAHVAIMVSPGGLTLGTLTHELTHFRLHRALGPRNLVQQPFPTWFDEGLATHVANHPRWNGTVTQAARNRVREVGRFWQLNNAFRELGVGMTYRAAAAEVAAIERNIARSGLLELIERTEAGEGFDDVLNEIRAR